MTKRYLADMIGEDYKRWQPGQTVLAATTTGSGKTWFVLNRLLPYAKAQGKHIVYYCNRKFLNMQVQANAQKQIFGALGEDRDGLSPYLHIRTYQHTERKRDFPNVIETDDTGFRQTIPARSILYYVFDEAMYFVQDASFSSSTHYWYEKSSAMERKDAVSVFLTATPEPLYLYQKSRKGGINELCRQFIARYSICEDICYRRWAPYLYLNPDVEQSMLKEYIGDPYKDLFAWVTDAYGQIADWADFYYEDERSLSARYEYADTYYFDRLDSLARLIAESVRESQQKSSEKESDGGKEREKTIEGAWLIFVRTLEDAKSLKVALKPLDCPSVVISSQFTRNYDGEPAKRKHTNKSVFSDLVNEEYLGTHVLISTSVLDCGITLRAHNVKNLVICQPNKTSFLQMLGRIRVQEGERINLYIQSFSPKQIEGYARKYRSDFLFLVHFLMINEVAPKSHFMNWREPDILHYDSNDFMDYLPEGTKKWLIQELERDKDKWRFLIDEGSRQSRQYDPQSVRSFHVNELAILHCLSQVFYFDQVLPQQDAGKYSFLKEQLSWIGKHYDPACWIDYQAPRDALYSFLRQISWRKQSMNKTEQAAFREKCYEYLSDLREPPESVQLVKKRHTVGSKDYPGMSKLNEIFIDLELPFQIVSKQSKAQKKDPQTGGKVIDPETGKPQIDDKSYWYLQPVDLETERRRLEEKRTEKRILQEIRIAEKMRKKTQTQKKDRNPNNPYGVVITKQPRKQNTAPITPPETESSKEHAPGMKVQILRGGKP